jgi:Ca2+-transporting ATPase
MELMAIFDETEGELFREFATSGEGLSAAEARTRLAKYGPNALKLKSKPLWHRLIEPFLDIFMIVLVLAAVLSLIGGNGVDAIIIIVIIAINITIDYVQQFSTERILRSLKKQTSQKVSVLRGGETIAIDSTGLVPGDIVLLSEGDKVPADGRIIVATEPRADESMLTGESELISKSAKTLTGIKPIYEQRNMLFSGTFLVAGNARMLVVRTGNDTEFGKIADLATQSISASPVQAKIDKLVKKIAIVVGILSAIAFAMSMASGIGVLDSLAFVITLAVSAVPEGLPIAISIILALGMRRMAAQKALVTNMRAIETIGVITTIATDKTGTLTMNKLTVQDTWLFARNRDKFMTALAQTVIDPESSHDPMDSAFLDFSKKHGKAHIETTPLRTYSFNQKLAMSGNLWNKGTKFNLTVKGSPESILDVCDVTEDERQKCLQQLAEFTSKGERVIGIAETVTNSKPTTLAAGVKSRHLEFLGFVSVSDQIRPESNAAVRRAKAAGVSVRMITGDHFETAYQIGKKIGIVDSREQVFDCSEINIIDEAELNSVVQNTYVFSRVTPEAKLKILGILKKQNITAMTGDGVNDVPAIAGADIGIAMGSGSYIARDAADIVLLDDNFKSIVVAMKEGRVIVSNIRRMLFYLLSTNTGEVLTMLGALFFSSTLPLTPVQILWINIVTDTFFVIPLGLEPPEDNIMKNKPEAPDSPILDKHIIVRMVLVALTMAATTLTIYLSYYGPLGHSGAGTLTFMSLAALQWANAFNARSSYQSIFVRIRVMNKKFYVCLVAAVALQLLVLLEPFRHWLHIGDVPIHDLVMVVALSFALPIVVVEIHKLLVRRLAKK